MIGPSLLQSSTPGWTTAVTATEYKQQLPLAVYTSIVHLETFFGYQDEQRPAKLYCEPMTI